MPEHGTEIALTVLAVQEQYSDLEIVPRYLILEAIKGTFSNVHVLPSHINVHCKNEMGKVISVAAE